MLLTSPPTTHSLTKIQKFALNASDLVSIF